MADTTYQPKVYKKSGGDVQVIASGGEIQVEAGGLVTDASNPIVRGTRTRVTIANVNAGSTLLAAVAGKAYRILNAYAIAYGGAVGAVTTVDILGTQSTSSVKLVAFAQASLTQSAVLKIGGTGATVLADGASFAACDVNTAITVGITGSSATTATGIDFILEYVLEQGAMFIERHDFTLTVNASGDATVYSSAPATGVVRQIRYVPDGTNPLATGADLTITAETSGLAIDTLTNIGTSAVQWAPRQATSDITGAAALYAVAGAAVNDLIAIAGERIKVVVAQGGVSKTGTLYIWVG